MVRVCGSLSLYWCDAHWITRTPCSTSTYTCSHSLGYSCRKTSPKTDVGGVFFPPVSGSVICLHERDKNWYMKSAGRFTVLSGLWRLYLFGCVFLIFEGIFVICSQCYKLVWYHVIIQFSSKTCCWSNLLIFHFLTRLPSEDNLRWQQIRKPLA